VCMGMRYGAERALPQALEHDISVVAQLLPQADPSAQTRQQASNTHTFAANRPPAADSPAEWQDCTMHTYYNAYVTLHTPKLNASHGVLLHNMLQKQHAAELACGKKRLCSGFEAGLQRRAEPILALSSMPVHSAQPSSGLPSARAISHSIPCAETYDSSNYSLCREHVMKHLHHGRPRHCTWVCRSRRT
jgi:hypothetical protein